MLSRPYAFDVHANSFFPLFLTLYVAQLVLAPVVTRSNWVCLWVGNTLYLAAVRHFALFSVEGDCETNDEFGASSSLNTLT